MSFSFKFTLTVWNLKNSVRLCNSILKHTHLRMPIPTAIQSRQAQAAEKSTQDGQHCSSGSK